MKNKYINEEEQGDAFLNIHTMGRDDVLSNKINYPYEPTPYKVLERLVNSGYITKESVLIDYGCGKGRVDFYLSYYAKCQCIGIDYDRRMIQSANDNLGNHHSVTFVCENAADYQLDATINCCYFFNPFDYSLLKCVLMRILESYYEHPREILLFFYYPSEDYMVTLMNYSEIEFLDEIECYDLYDKYDQRETIVIFKLK